jgi:2-iminobutanoate/2-iminopropanoate deaminase
MTRNAPRPKSMAEPAPPYSPVIVSGDLVYTAGQVALDAEGNVVPGGIEEQTEQVLDNVERCLAAAGCSLDDVVKVTAFVSDLDGFEGFNRAYARRFTTPYPARSTVGVRLAPGLLVEIEVVARLPAAEGEGG